jgi:hypothetical protein
VAPRDRAPDRAPPTFFLLSPADCRGERAAMLADPRAQFPLARQLQTPDGAPLGDVFAFLSALYFRGKLAYARAFAQAPAGLPGVLVITPGDGLCRDSERVSAQRLRALATVPIDHENPYYCEPLVRDARALEQLGGDSARFVLLGSVASAKYVEPLLSVFGERLLFPSDFVGRGDMSRGGLLLRSAREGRELPYAPVQGAVLRGPRAPRLPKLRRTS